MKLITKLKVYIILITCFLLVTSHTYAQGNQRVYIQGVPRIHQMPQLPTGCEVTALTMLLNYYGYPHTKLKVAQDIPKVPLYYTKNGKAYGGHPNDGFVGNPASKAAYGVYVKPIENLINKYTKEQAYNLTGTAFEDLFSIIDKGQPIMLWGSIGMGSVYPTRTWQTEAYGKFTWLANEHAVVLVGYDHQHVWVNDPWTGKEQKYKISAVKLAYDKLGKQAITLKPPHLQYEVTKSIINEIEYTTLRFENAQYIKVREAMELWGWKIFIEDRIMQLRFEDYTADIDFELNYLVESDIELDYKLVSGSLYIHTDSYRELLQYNKSRKEARDIVISEEVSELEKDMD